jgi:hypothetical protein
VDALVLADHRAVIRRVAETVGVRAVRVAADARWQEIDRPEDIALWQDDHDVPADGPPRS